MKTKLLSSALIVGAILFTGCNQPQNTIALEIEPEWILNPYLDGDSIAAVGCSKTHFKGKSYQQKIAVSIAIDQIAMQNKMTVSNSTVRAKKVTNGRRLSSSSNSSSLQSVDKVSVSTKVKKIYNKRNGDMCVWVVQK